MRRGHPRAEDACNAFFLNRGVATIVREEEMHTLPDRFLALLMEGRFDAPFV